MEENVIIKTPRDKSKKGYYLVTNSRRNLEDTADVTYNSYDIWTGDKWLLSTLLHTPIIDVLGYVDREESTYINVINELEGLNDKKEKEI